MDRVPIDSALSLDTICYPRANTERCLQLVRSLISAGVEYLCTDAPRRVLPSSKVGILGKGHAGVVFLGYGSEGLVAVKVRRTDSKRATLLEEAKLQDIASRSGDAPKVLGYYEDYIVSAPVMGPTLGEAVSQPLSPEEFIRVLREALNAAYALDLAGILHHELHRPLRNVLFTGEPSVSRAVIVDYDSASEGCGNIAKMASWLFRFTGVYFGNLRYRIREYKRGCESETGVLIHEILEVVEERMIDAFGGVGP